MKGLAYLVGAMIFIILLIAGAPITLKHPSISNIAFELVVAAFFALAMWLYIRVNRAPREENER